MDSVMNIQRIESGWVFSIRIKGKRYSKRFSDARYGGEMASFDAATKYKISILDKHGIEERIKKSPNNMIGVSRTSSYRKKWPDRQQQYSKEEYWQATWTDGVGKQHTKRFSIKKYGEKQAERLAVQARKDALEAIEGGFDPRFVQPSNKYAKLWRYMDFTKFLSMVEDSAVFFSPASSFEDPYEGFLPKGNVVFGRFVKSKSKKENSSNVAVADKKKILISCWHLSRYESAAMWKLYGKGNETICVTTKYNKLKNQLIKGAQIGLVRYVDFNTAWVPENNPYYPYMFKRRSFEHEKEVRVLLDYEKICQEDFFLGVSNGFKNKVDLNILVDEIFVAPDASDWFFELVEKISRKYQLAAKVKRSMLLELP